MRESSILALGAVSEGCCQGLAPYITGIVQMMLPKLEDGRPMVGVVCMVRWCYMAGCGSPHGGLWLRPIMQAAPHGRAIAVH